MYPTHPFLHTVGHLHCCRSSGCWKARVAALGGDVDRDASLCRMPRESGGQSVAACMALIEPNEVSRAIERYLSDPQEASCAC
jgi:hypothetical protein